MSAWSLKTRHAPCRHCRDAGGSMVIRLRPCMRSSTSLSSTPPPPGTNFGNDLLLNGGGGALDIVHGGSRLIIDPHTPTMPGRSTSGFCRPGRHCLHSARSGGPHNEHCGFWKGLSEVIRWTHRSRRVHPSRLPMECVFFLACWYEYTVHTEVGCRK